MDADCLVVFTTLEKNFCLKHKKNIEFPAIINDITTHDAVKQLQDHTTDAIKHLDNICCCCSRFVNPAQLKQISEKNLIIMAALNTAILHYYNLDYCSNDSESFDFCCECWNRIREGQLPKFGISNKMPQLCC